MKTPTHVETADDVVIWGLDAIAREKHRRIKQYGQCVDPATQMPVELPERLLSMYPLFRMTHCARTRKCDKCGERIAPLELHFICFGLPSCQRGCRDRPARSFTLIRGGKA